MPEIFRDAEPGQMFFLTYTDDLMIKIQTLRLEDGTVVNAVSADTGVAFCVKEEARLLNRSEKNKLKKEMSDKA